MSVIYSNNERLLRVPRQDVSARTLTSGGSAPSNRCALHATDRMRCGAREGQTGEDPRRRRERRCAIASRRSARRACASARASIRLREVRERAVATDRHHRRGGRATGLRHLGHHRGGAPGHRGVDRGRGSSSISAISRDRSGSPTFRPSAGPRLPDRPAAVEDLPGHADAPSRRPWATSIAEKEGDEPFSRTRRSWCCSPRRPRPRSPARPRAEQRARADLEALIETSPVGVRVRRRHRPPGLAQPRGAADRGQPAHAGRTAEDLLGILTCRFADGREIALDKWLRGR